MLLRNQTKYELRVADLLKEAGVRFIPQKGFFNQATHYIVDFYLPKNKKLCLEIDGSHHFQGSQLDYDRKRSYFLEKSRGFRVLRISNDVASSITKEELVALIS